MKTNKLKLMAIIAFMGLSLNSCDNNEENPIVPVVDNTITGVASRSNNLSLLVKALTKADLAGTLQGNGPFTVFAPTNAAFEAAGFTASVIDGLDAAGVATLKEVLLNHVVSGRFASNTLSTTYVNTLASGPGGSKLSMLIDVSTGVVLNGGPSTASGDGKKGASVTTADVNASNGIIHIVNGIIGLPTILDHAKNNSNFSALVSAVTSTSTSGNFGNQTAIAAALTNATATAPFTVFAPVNSAFDAAFANGAWANGATGAPVSRVLLYHVLNGNVRSTAITTTEQSLPTLATSPTLNVRVQLNPTAKITDTQNLVGDIAVVDVQGTNGVVHAITRVLRPF
jgi:uncharacterized surface protein with fasciclin (FAS1) repeats